MEEQSDKKEIKIAVSSEERIAGMLLTSLETFNQFMGIALGLEVESLVEENSFVVANRRATSLIKSVNALKQVIRIARPNISVMIDNKPSNEENKDVGLLQAVRQDLDEILKAIDMSELTSNINDDLIIEREIGCPYSQKVYRLSSNFWRLSRELEELYEEVYSVCLRNGLISPALEIKRRTKNNAIR
jgi:hypothetical protein